MSDLAFGLTLLIVGMGGTLLSLYVIALLIQVMNWVVAKTRRDRPS